MTTGYTPRFEKFEMNCGTLMTLSLRPKTSYEPTYVDSICTGIFGDDVPVAEVDVGQRFWDDKSCSYVADKQKLNSLVRKMNKKTSNKKNQKQYKNIQKPKNIVSHFESLPSEIISLIMDDLDPLSLDYFLRAFPAYRELFVGNKEMIKRVAQKLSPWSQLEYDHMFDLYTSWAIDFYNSGDPALDKIRRYRAYCEVVFGDTFGNPAGMGLIGVVPHFFNPIPTMFTVRTFNRIASRDLHFTVHMNQTPLRTPGLVESMYDFIAHPIVPDRVVARAFDLKPQCGSYCLCPIRSKCTSTCVETPLDDDATIFGPSSSQETLLPKRLPFRERGANIIKKTLAFLFRNFTPQSGERLCPRGCTRNHTHKKFEDIKRLVEGAVQVVNSPEHPSPQSGRGFLSSFAPSVNLTHSVDSSVTSAVDSLTTALNSLTAAIPGLDDLEAAKQSVGKSLAPLGLVLPLVIVIITGVILLMRSSDRKYLIAITAVAGVLLLLANDERLRTSISDLLTKINDYVVSPNTVTIQAGNSLPETATSFLVLFLSYYITGEVAEGNKLRVLFTKILPDMKKMKDGVNFAGNEVIGLVQTGVNFVRTELLGIPAVSFTKTHKPDVDDWVESCTKCEAMFKDGRMKITITNANVVRHLLTRGRALVAACTDRKEAQEVRDVLNLWLRVMEKMHEEFESSGIRAATIRQEPATIVIAGGYAVGKTTLVKPFERSVASRIFNDFQLEEYRKNPDAYCYNENEATGFKDGYVGQPIMVWDDAGQSRDVAGTTDNAYFHFMQAKSIFPYKLHMASLGQKANTYFTSTCIIMTTNEQDFKPASINTHGALKRRFDLSVIVTPKAEYTDPATLGDNLWARRLRPDIWKGTAMEADAPGFSKDIYEFHEYDYMTLQLTGRTFDYDGLVDEYVRIYKKFEAKHHRYMIDLENLLNEEIHKRPAQVQAGLLSRDAINRIYLSAGRAALTQMFHGSGRGENFADNSGNVQEDEAIDSVRFDTRTGQFLEGMGDDYNSLDLDEIIQWAGGQDIPLLVSSDIDLPLILPPLNYDREQIERFLTAYNGLTDEQRDHVNADFRTIIERSVNLRDGIESIITYIRELTWRRFGSLLVRAAERGFDALRMCLHFIGSKFTSIVTQGYESVFKFDFQSFFSEFKAKLHNAWNWATTKYDELQAAHPNLVLVCKLLGAGSLIMAAAYMFWNSMPQIETQSWTKRNKRGNKAQGRLRTRAKTHVHGNTSDVVLQAGVDQGVAALIEKCYSHSTYFLNYAHLFDETHGMDDLIKENGVDSVMSEFGTVLFIKETVAIMPMHFQKKLLAAIKEGYITRTSRLRLTRCTDLKIYYEFPVTYILDAKQVTAHNGRDVIAVQLPREILHHPDITDRFVSLSYLENRKSMVGILPVWRRGKQWCLSSFIKPCDSYEVKVYDETIRYRTLYEYNLNTRVGDCGAVLFLDDSASGKQKILGIHTLGNGSFGCSAAVTKEDIDLMIKEFSFVSKQEADADETYVVQSVTTPGTGFIPLIKLDKPVFAADETKIEKSALYGAWGPAKKAPAQLKRFEKDGVLVDPLVLAASKYGNSNVYVDPHLMKVAAEHYLGHLYGIDKNNIPNPRELSFDESICGIPGSEGVQAMNRSTSLGYPYVLNPVRGKPGKTRFLGHEGEIDTTAPEYRMYIDHITRIENDMKNGTMPRFYGIDCKKDEKRELEKVSVGKTRLFVTFNFDHAVLMGKHFGAFFDWYGKMKIDNECAGGVNMYDAVHLERIANRFKRFGGKSVFGDFSGFDTSFNTTVAWAIFDIIDLWYGDKGSRQIRTMLWLAAVNSKHIIHNNVYKWDHGMPSGMRFTMYINTMTNCVNIRAAYTIIRGGLEHIIEFSDHVLPIVLGDDNGLAIHPSMADILTQDAWTKAFAVIGYKYTMEDKKSSSAIGVRDFTECSFLKRTMRFDEGSDRWVAQLDLDSILEPPYWTKNTREAETIVKSEVEVALRELALYPRIVYDTWAPKIINACVERMSWRPTVTDYKVNQQLVFKDTCLC